MAAKTLNGQIQTHQSPAWERTYKRYQQTQSNQGHFVEYLLALNQYRIGNGIQIPFVHSKSHAIPREMIQKVHISNLTSEPATVSFSYDKMSHSSLHLSQDILYHHHKEQHNTEKYHPFIEYKPSPVDQITSRSNESLDEMFLNHSSSSFVIGGLDHQSGPVSAFESYDLHNNSRIDSFNPDRSLPFLNHDHSFETLPSHSRTTSFDNLPKKNIVNLSHHSRSNSFENFHYHSKSNAFHHSRTNSLNNVFESLNQFHSFTNVIETQETQGYPNHPLNLLAVQQVDAFEKPSLKHRPILTDDLRHKNDRKLNDDDTFIILPTPPVSPQLDVESIEKLKEKDTFY